MGLYINSAAGGLALQRSLYQASVMQSNIMKRLSSGIKINSASDDAAGLSLSQKLTSVINGNTVAKNNAQTGVSLLNTADGALSVMTNSLERIRNLAVQAANGVYTDSERQMLQNEVSQLSSDVRQTRASTSFSDKKVFNMDDSEAIAKGYDQAHIIHTADEFIDKIENGDDGNYILTDDLDFSSMGTFTNAVFEFQFGGKLDGNGHTLSNITIVANDDDYTYGSTGIFAQLNGAEIKNLNLQNITIDAMSNLTTDAPETGMLTGWANNSTITNVSASGTVSAHGSTGGLIGMITASSVVSNCSATGSVYSPNYGSMATGILSTAGGLVGYAESSSVTNSYSSADVNGSADVGGLIGYMDGSTVSGSYATGDVSSIGYQNAAGKESWAGGLVGGIYYVSSVTDCYATGNVTADPTAGVGAPTGGYAGGLVGYVGNQANVIRRSYAANGSVSTAQGGSGGLAGRVGASAIVDGTNFYKNNKTIAATSGPVGAVVNANVAAPPTGTWSTAIWDKSSAIPTLKSAGANKTPVTFDSKTSLQIGTEADDTSQVEFNVSFAFGNMNFDVTNQSSANATISDVDKMMTYLNTMRSNVGSSINKLSSVMQIQDNRINNLSSSKSTINDADIAIESANLMKDSIRNQAAVALMSQTKGLDASLLMQLIG